MANANLGASVVPDLMRVYESLTQSKTPQSTTTISHNAILSQSELSQSETSRPQHQTLDNHVATTPSLNQHSSLYQSDPSILGGLAATIPPLSAASTHVIHSAAHTTPSLNQHVSRYQSDPSILGEVAANIPPLAAASTHVMHSAAHTEAPALPQDYAATCPSITKTRPRRSASLKRPAEWCKTLSDDSSKTRRKKRGGDGRWSKRFAWPDELHRDFVSAVFDVGLKHSSPSGVLDHMQASEEVTTERIKSHLQKYRLHRQKSKKEFMSSYESTMLRMKSGENDHSPASLSCGEIASHLTYSTMIEKEVSDADPSSLVEGGILQLPQLTEDEKCSPVGASMGYLMGLFFSLKQQLHTQRCAQGHIPIEPASTFSNTPPPAVLPIEQTHSSSQFPDQFHQRAENCVNTVESFSQGPPADQTNLFTLPPESALMNQYQPQQQSHQGHQGHHTNPSSANAASSSVPSSSMPPPDTRNNTPIDESNMMKRDMQSQMAFQNKMRKLKEQELSKYTQAAEVQADHLGIGKDNASLYLEDNMQTAGISTDCAAKADADALGIGGTDFWTSDEVMDDQLFEFLMND